MRSWLAPAAIGLALGVVALVAVTSFAAARPPTDAKRVETLLRELRCPDCQGLSVAESPTRSGQSIRQQVGDLVADGASDEAIRAHFVARYGEWILLGPNLALAWFLPFAVILAAGIGLGVWLVARRSAAPAPPAPSAEATRRIHDEVEAMDA
jgi:cytochrome c-type biogenesis protein CcmH